MNKLLFEKEYAHIDILAQDFILGGYVVDNGDFICRIDQAPQIQLSPCTDSIASNIDHSHQSDSAHPKYLANPNTHMNALHDLPNQQPDWMINNSDIIRPNHRGDPIVKVQIEEEDALVNG